MSKSIDEILEWFAGFIEPEDYMEQAKDQLYQLLKDEIIYTTSLPKGVDKTCARLLNDQQLTALNKLFDREA
jgi:hypothetical protein